MQTQNIEPLRAEINILRRDKLAGKLSPCERLVVGYEIADAVAALLADNKQISTGHRSAMYAHFMSLLNRDGEAAARNFAAVLCGMVGMVCTPHNIPYDDPPDDATDWNAAAIQ